MSNGLLSETDVLAGGALLAVLFAVMVVNELRWKIQEWRFELDD